MSGTGRCPRKCSVRWIRSTALSPSELCSVPRSSIAGCNAPRTAAGSSMAKKTRHRSGSGPVANLDGDLAVASQRAFPVIDELRKPARRPLWAEQVNARRQDQNHGQVHLVTAALEHGGDRKAAVG